MRKPLLLSLVLLTASFLAATDYYVANTGSNVNNGLSADAPLQTIAYAQTNHCGPGNRILLHRGDAFAEVINPPCNGSAGHFMQYDSYGLSSSIPPTQVMGDGTHSCNIVNRSYIAVQHFDLRTKQCLVQNSTNIVLMYNIIRDVHGDHGVYAAAASTVSLFNNDIMAVDFDGVRGRDINGPSPTLTLTNNIIIGTGAGGLNTPTYTGVDLFTNTNLEYDHNLISGNGRITGTCQPYPSCDLIGQNGFAGTITNGGGNLMTSYLPRFVSWPHAENAYSFSHDGDSYNQLDMVAGDQVIKQGGGSYTYNGVTVDSQVLAGTYPNIENLKISYPVVAGRIVTASNASTLKAALPVLFSDGVGVPEDHTWSHGGLSSTNMFEILSTTNANPTINIDTTLHQITLGTTTPGNTIVFNYAGSCTYGTCMNGDFFAALGGTCTFTSGNLPGFAACTGHGWSPSQDYNNISIQVNVQAKFMTYSGKDVLVDTHGAVPLATPYHAAMNVQNWLESELKDADTWIAANSGGYANHMNVDVNPAGNSVPVVQLYTRDTLTNTSGEPYVGDKAFVSAGNTTIYNFDVMQAGTLAAWFTFNPGGHTDDSTIIASADHMAGFLLGGSNFFNSYWHTNCPSGCDISFHSIVVAMNELVKQGVNVVPFSTYINTIRSDGHSCANSSGGYVCTKALADTGNFHLLPGSPVIDTGAALTSVCPTGLSCNIDMDGVDQTAHGTGWEMGAYVFVYSMLLTPVNGGTNVNALLPVQFNWTPTSGAQTYTLWVGTTQGGNDAYNSGETQATSASVSLNPNTNYYARIWTELAGTWLYSDSSFTTAPGNTPSVLITPANGATNVSVPVQFTWTAASGEQTYTLWVGTTPGGNDAYNSGETQATSASVTLNSSTTYYARIWTEFAGNWYYNDSSFTTGAGLVPSVLITPANGATNVSVPVQFSWTAAPGEQTYTLWVGTSLGASDAYNSGETQATSASVTLNGNTTYYARIWTEFAGAWYYNDSSFTTANAGLPYSVLINPPDGSMQSATSPITFQWTAVTPPPQAYYLYVGTSPGASDVYNSGETQNTSVTIGPLGAGTFYVTIWTDVSGTWYQSPSYFTTQTQMRRR